MVVTTMSSRHTFYSSIYLTSASIIIASNIDFWSFIIFRLLLLSLAMYQTLGHVSSAMTKHRVVTNSKIIDHGNRIIDGMLHGIYAILFVNSSLHDKYCYHWISIIHSWICIHHIFKYGDNDFCMKLRRKSPFMNRLDAMLHFTSFIKLMIEGGMFNDAMNNTVYVFVSLVYIAMRRRHLIW